MVNGFRLFYTLDGKHALIDNTDKDDSGIPDIVENVAIQLNVANRLFSDVFKFIQPAYNTRYQNKLQMIDVHFLSLKTNGNSGDALVNYHYKDVETDDLSSLSITISTKIKAGNLTPAHELFHAYQNGYTLFKNKWLTEGTARWMEYAFRQGTGKQQPLPDSPKLLDQLLNTSYDAQYFWNRVTSLCSKDPMQYRLPKELEHSQYIPTSKNVIEDNQFYGYSFILNLFQNLRLFDFQISLQRGLDKYHWKESEQKSMKNNKYILLALKKTIKQSDCNENDEMSRFLVVIDEYIR